VWFVGVLLVYFFVPLSGERWRRTGGGKDQEPRPDAPHIDAARTRIRKGVYPKRR